MGTKRTPPTPMTPMQNPDTKEPIVNRENDHHTRGAGNAKNDRSKLMAVVMPAVRDAGLIILIIIIRIFM